MLFIDFFCIFSFSLSNTALPILMLSSRFSKVGTCWVKNNEILEEAMSNDSPIACIIGSKALNSPIAPAKQSAASEKILS